VSSEATKAAEPLESALRLTPTAANRAFAVYAVLLLVGGWAYAAFSIRSDYHRTLESTREQVHVAAAGLEAQLGAMLNDGIGAATAAANELDASGGVGAVTDAQAAATLSRMLTGGDYVRSLFIGSSTRYARAGREGKVESGAPPAWFTTFTRASSAGTGTVGDLLDDPDRPPHHVIPIARRIKAADGQDLWVGGLFDFHELNERYRRSIGTSNALLLLSLDGQILVRVPTPKGVDVTKIPTRDSEIVRRALQSPNGGVVEGFAPLLNTEAIVAYQRLTEYPLYVAAGVRRDSALAGWDTRRRDTLVLTAVASVVLVFMTWMLNHYVGALRGRDQSWRESEARYRSLIEALPEAVFVHRGREPLFGNRAAAALVGAPSVAALAKYDALSFVEESDREALRERGRLILEEGLAAAPREVRLKRLDGSVLWVESEGVPVTFDGKPAVQTIVRDITARKMQEQDRAAAGQRSRRQSEALLRLAARADTHADDFRATLTRICEVASDVLTAHRVAVWVLDGEQARCHASYVVETRPAVPACSVDSRGLTTLAAALRSQRVIALADLAMDPRGFQLPQSGVLEAGAMSAVAAAIHIAGELEAFALVTHHGEPREWHDDELTFVGGIADQIAQARLDAERERAFDELRDLAGQLVRAQDEARRTIGRDLHDSTGQTLAALEVNLARLGRATAELPPEQRRILAECTDLASQCSAEIRTASYLLHPPLLDELGLASALRWLVDGFRDRSGIEVSLELQPSLPRLDKDSELALFRVAQEALTNVHRHSGSSWARLSVKSGVQGVVLEIEDAGRGLPASRARSRESTPALSVGLAGMRERMRQIGGNVVVESAATGTRVRASLPRAPAVGMSGSA
jgi:PAS domain S-box-containing protein